MPLTLVREYSQNFKEILGLKSLKFDFPVTTLKPQLGVITFDDFRQISIADLPGLIEGAHKNHGLGHRFLKHVERTKLLAFLIDINGFQLSHEYPLRQPFETVALLNRELELYGRGILSKPTLLIVNKMDTDGAEAKWKKLKVLLENYKGNYLILIEELLILLLNNIVFKNYLDNIRLLPPDMQPDVPLVFDDIIDISIEKDPDAVKNLALKFRNHLDVLSGYEISQLPIQQKLLDASDTEKKLLIQNSLNEHNRKQLS